MNKQASLSNLQQRQNCHFYKQVMGLKNKNCLKTLDNILAIEQSKNILESEFMNHSLYSSEESALALEPTAELPARRNPADLRKPEEADKQDDRSPRSTERLTFHAKDVPKFHELVMSEANSNMEIATQKQFKKVKEVMNQYYRSEGLDEIEKGTALSLYRKKSIKKKKKEKSQAKDQPAEGKAQDNETQKF